MEAAEVTCPKVGETTLVSTPEYCTVLKTLLAVARNSMLRVSPNCMVFESDILFWTVPGPAMELREALPKTAQRIAWISRCRRSKGRGVEPLFQRAGARRNRNPGTRSGRSVPAVPRATLGCAA